MWVLKATWRPPVTGWDGEAEPGQARLLELLSHLFHVLRCHLKCHLKRRALFLEQNHSKNHCLEIDALGFSNSDGKGSFSSSILTL